MTSAAEAFSVVAALLIAPVIAQTPPAGAAIDPATFSYSRALPASSGLTSVALDVHALAHSRGPSENFADVRIVDKQNQQIPYVLEKRSEPIGIVLSIRSIAAPRFRDVYPTGVRRTFYQLPLPVEDLPFAVLTVTTTMQVFERDVRVGVEREPDSVHRDVWFQTLATSRWKNVSSPTAARSLSLFLGTVPTATLLLIVEDGDNAPLPIASARLEVPSYSLRFYAPAGEPLRLLYGTSAVSPPHYDLALRTAEVRNGSAREITLGPELPSPSAPAKRPIVSPTVFWIALAIAVVVLLGLIARLARSSR